MAHTASLPLAVLSRVQGASPTTHLGGERGPSEPGHRGKGYSAEEEQMGQLTPALSP